MNFPKIEKSNEILDVVIKKVRKTKDYQRNEMAVKYISLYQTEITERLTNVLSKLPDYQTTNKYYSMMFKNICPKTTMDKYKNHISKSISVINKLSERYKRQVLRLLANKKDRYRKEGFVKLKKEYVGRLASVLKRLDNTFDKLLILEKEFKRIASPRFELRTIVLTGLPNSGKTTYLSMITEACPEINSYAFTTKALNLGYFKRRQMMYQVVDTPGIIHREFKEMNAIEKQAIAAIKGLADLIVFVYNPNLEKEKQEEILRVIKENNPEKKVVVSSTYGKDARLDGEENITMEELLESYVVEKKDLVSQKQ